MQRFIIKNNAHYMPILLIICGGPIGKSSEKTVVTAQTNPATKKQTKTDLDQKTSFSKRAK